MLAAVRQAVTVEGDDLFSATLLDSVLLCRYLGDGAESARPCFTDAWGPFGRGYPGAQLNRHGFGGRERRTVASRTGSMRRYRVIPEE